MMPLRISCLIICMESPFKSSASWCTLIERGDSNTGSLGAAVSLAAFSFSATGSAGLFGLLTLGTNDSFNQPGAFFDQPLTVLPGKAAFQMKLQLFTFQSFFPAGGVRADISAPPLIFTGAIDLHIDGASPDQPHQFPLVSDAAAGHAGPLRRPLHGDGTRRHLPHPPPPHSRGGLSWLLHC